MFFVRYVLVGRQKSQMKNIFYCKKTKILLVLNNYTSYKELNSN